MVISETLQLPFTGGQLIFLGVVNVTAFSALFLLLYKLKINYSQLIVY
jgi:hypothetical protein